MRSRIDLNKDWIFEGEHMVHLPHNAVDLPFSYFDETEYQRPFTYERHFDADPAWHGKEVELFFEGVMANAKVSLNGEELGGHLDGYTPFSIRLTDKLNATGNHIKVVVDGSENPEIPPFGGAIDYLTYAGIYREVWLDILAPVSIENVKIETPDVLSDAKKVLAFVTLKNPKNLGLSGTLSARVLDSAGNEIASKSQAVADAAVTFEFDGLDNIELWTLNNPALYTLELTVSTPEGQDSLSQRFGFRSAEFTVDGFFLNGEKLKLRGLNRHQSFPHIGYALGKSAQVRDADILKHELHLNMVRTSHYPQSKYFLDRCDEIGLLVFEEIPGWQHIGGQAWQDESVRNVERMIRRDWNHPSIVIWGVRVNESADNHDFYIRTNALARELDSTRSTGGVRYITDSELLEDVYTMNDFFLGNEELGGNRPRTPLRPQQEVTGLDHVVPYMITEYNGHMYPTKVWDQEQRQSEHVTRHLQVMNAAYGDPQIAGAIGWCAFDYNTHKDFGSGDRICHHGVMDMFREPKFAAYAYASQCSQDEAIVLKPVTFWARGERNIGGVLPLIILTNCDEVEIRYGDNPPKRIGPDRENYPHLPNAPVVVDQRHFSAEELGLWGMTWEHGEIIGLVDGQEVARAQFAADPVPTTLEVVADSTQIGSRDDVRVIVRVLDQAGNRLPFYPEPVSIDVKGPAYLAGPTVAPLRGGTTGFWIKSYDAGEIEITISEVRLGTKSLTITAQ